MLKVYEKPCENCLLSKDAIVGTERRSEIIKTCKRQQTYFICHVSSISEDGKEQNICCKRFYDQLGHYSQLIRIAERLNQVEFVPLPNSPKLPSHKDMKKAP